MLLLRTYLFSRRQPFQNEAMRVQFVRALIKLGRKQERGGLRQPSEVRQRCVSKQLDLFSEQEIPV
jgi:hypothetical protein